MASDTATIKSSGPVIYCDWVTTYTYTSGGTHYYTVSLTIRKPSGTYGYYIEGVLNNITQRFKDNSPSSWSSYGPLTWTGVPNGSTVTWNRGGSGAFNSFTPTYDTPLWNDINAYYPNGSNQGALTFNLKTSDNGSWTDITNEPSDWYHLYGTTATISSIRCNVTGAHYSSNNVTKTAASSFTWTINTANWAACLYTSWNTYYVTFNANGGTGTMATETFTYNTSKALTTNTFTRSGYTFLGWSTDSSATEPTYTDGQSVSNLTATSGGTFVLYAVWKEVPAGKMQLKTDSGWVEGDAYVKTDTGWTKAKRVYVKTKKGWIVSKSKTDE